MKITRRLSHSTSFIKARTLRLFGLIVTIPGLFLLNASAANPASEMFKTGPAGTTGGVDPHGDSWASIHNSVEQFMHPGFMLRLFLSFMLAVACAWVISWHPRRSALIDPLAKREERKALIILGLVGAIIAELSGTNQTLAFVIFGVGALVRFRTALDDPKLTGKAIIVVVIGLACGMGSWVMAVFVTAFTWLLSLWLEAQVSCRIKIQIDGKGDTQDVFNAVQTYFSKRKCKVHSSSIKVEKRQVSFFILIPLGLSPQQLEDDLRAAIPQPEDCDIAIQAV
jgi:hypothetical protein